MSRRTRYASELLGTYLLVLVGPGTAATVSLVQGMTQFEAFLVIGFSFGATVAVIVMLLGKLSGAHIDPAITVAHTIAGKTDRKLLIPYVLFQIIGALFAGLTLKVLFSPYGSPASLGTTKLADGVSIPLGILLETLGTFVLAMSGFLASSRTHRKPLEAAVIGSTLFLIILLLGPVTNASLNPARSLGPAVASGYLNNLYVYWAGPLAGGLVAGVTYRFLRGRKLAKGPVLFVCVENAGRSQIAETFAKTYGLYAQSAGTVPAGGINLTVVTVMLERGIDISANQPKILSTGLIQDASLVVTMGCSIEEACPRPLIDQMQKKLVEWHLEDPKGKSIEGVRRIRDEIEGKVETLASSLREARTSTERDKLSLPKGHLK